MAFTFQNITLPTGATFEIRASLGGTGGTVERRGEATLVLEPGTMIEIVLDHPIER